MIKLVDILKESKRYKSITKKTLRETKNKTLQLFVIEDILQSGALSINEVKALREFFAYRKSKVMPVLNENTLRLIDNEMLKEGFIDWIKEKGKSFTNFLKSGWDKIKKAWGNFKDFVSGIISQLKKGMADAWKQTVQRFKDSFEWANDVVKKIEEIISKNASELYGKIAGKVSKIANIEPKEVHTQLPKEIETFGKASKHIFSVTKSNFVELETFEKDALEGNLKGNVDLEQEHVRFLKDKKLVETLINKTRRLYESAIAHPEDLLKKYPLLKKIVTVILKIFKYTFGIFSTIIKKAAQFLAENVLSIVNGVCQMTNGPVDPNNYAAMAAIIGELAEAAGHKIHLLHEKIEMAIDFISNIVKLACPPIAPNVEIITQAFHIAANFFFVYAIATVVLNVIVPAIKKFSSWLDEKMKNDAAFASTVNTALASVSSPGYRGVSGS